MSFQPDSDFLFQQLEFRIAGDEIGLLILSQRGTESVCQTDFETRFEIGGGVRQNAGRGMKSIGRACNIFEASSHAAVPSFFRMEYFTLRNAIPAKVLDSFARIAYFRDEPGADLIENLLVTATKKDSPLHTTDVNYADRFRSFFLCSAHPSSIDLSGKKDTGQKRRSWS